MTNRTARRLLIASALLVPIAAACESGGEADDAGVAAGRF